MPQAQADGIGFACVHPSKRVGIRRTNRQKIDRGQAARPCELDFVGGFAQGKVAIDLQEAVSIHLQMAAGLRQLARAGIHAQAQGVARCAVVDGQRRGLVVNQAAVGGGAVEHHLQAGRLHRQAVDTLQLRRRGAGLQTRPLTGRIRHIAGQHQAKRRARQTQPRAIRARPVHANKGTEVLAANRQHLGGGSAAIAQRHALGFLFNGELAAELHKAVHVQIELAAGLEQTAFAAIGRQIEGFTRHRDALAVAADKISDALARRRSVVSQRQTAGRHGHAADARQAGRAQRAAQAGPLVRAVVFVREQAEYKL